MGGNIELPYGADKDDLQRCNKIIGNLTNSNNNLDEIALEVMNLSYSTGDNYSDEVLLSYLKTYLKFN